MPNDREDHLFPPRPELLESVGGLESLEAPGEDNYSAILETICGATDDSQPVEQYDGSLGVTIAFVNANQGSVGQLQWNNDLATKYTSPGNVNNARWGTGTLLANNLFLTAGHNFDQTGNNWTRPRVNGTFNTISPQEIATNMHVNFNYQVDASGNPRPEQSFPVVSLVEYRLGNLDFAICRLGGNAAATFGTGRVATTNAAVGDTVAILGHPAGARKRVEAGTVFAVGGNSITYDNIDTLGGNSGSGILRSTDGRIVGVHTNGGCNAQGTGQNRGFPIEAIVAASPTLQNLISSAITNAASDAATTNLTSDVGPTTTAVTDATRTNLSNDVTTLASIDRFPTSAFIDRGTDLLADRSGTLKSLDDRKLPGRDKQLGDVKLPGNDGRFDPFGGVGRPFILANPHHAPGIGEAMAAQEVHAQYDATLLQLEQAMQQAQYELAALEQEYQRVVAEYQATFGGQ
ncbi:MAG TPA: trypsin-like peptidase domain-containing protein [Thermoanaerobaculia bacterium]|nr:trypsin-like peptidase domain-containing protein [Thermoanaerobaculia bacterium]